MLRKTGIGGGLLLLHVTVVAVCVATLLLPAAASGAEDASVGGGGGGEREKVTAVNRSGAHGGGYTRHHPGRRVCSKVSERPSKTRQAYSKPTYKQYREKCFGNQICQGVKLVYETHYRDIVVQSTNQVSYTCCPGWSQVNNRSHGCKRAVCSKPCLNGGKCVKPELCGCLTGFTGPQCEIETDMNAPHCSKPCLNGGKCISGGFCSCLKGFGGAYCEVDLNKPFCSKGCENGGTCARHEVCRCPKGFMGRRCETDIDECKEDKPCDQICHNTHGSYRCGCKEDFVLQGDGESCRKESNDGGLEAKDMEIELLDKRLLKLETMIGEQHKNGVSKDDLKLIYKDMNYLSNDVGNLKSQMNDMESYKNDIFILKNRLNYIERRTEKIDEPSIKYDKIRKCTFNNKICI